jgi:hypothetical protein
MVKVQIQVDDHYNAFLQITFYIHSNINEILIEKVTFILPL